MRRERRLTGSMWMIDSATVDAMEKHPDEAQYGEVVGLLTDLVRIDT